MKQCPLVPHSLSIHHGHWTHGTDINACTLTLLLSSKKNSWLSIFGPGNVASIQPLASENRLCSVLLDSCKPSLQLLAKTTAAWGSFTATNFFTMPYSQPLLWLFHTDPAVAGVFAVEVVHSLACVPCSKLAFLLLGSLLLPTSLLLLGCHRLVSDVMAHRHFHGHNFSTNINF